MSSINKRMIIEKFNNTPPFNMKKEDESPTDISINCFQHVEQSFRIIMEHLSSIPSKYDIDIYITTKNMKNRKKFMPPQKRRNIAPKVLDSFKKATPKMIHLGTNLKQQDGNNPRKNAPAVPVRTLYTNKDFGSRKGYRQKIKKSYCPSNLTIKVDKSTSTTGIYCMKCIKKEVENVNVGRSRIPIRRHDKMKLSTETVQDPRIINDNYKPTDNFAGSKSWVFLKPERTFIIESKSHKEKIELIEKLSPKKIEKQRQPERSNYMGMINTARNKLPKMKKSSEVIVSDNCDWSNNPSKVLKRPEHINFPRETKDAVELMIHSKHFAKPPLARYLKNQQPPSASANGMPKKPHVFASKKGEVIPRHVETRLKDKNLHAAKGINSKYLQAFEFICNIQTLLNRGRKMQKNNPDKPLRTYQKLSTKK